GGFNVTNAIGLATKNGVVHALWQDIDTSTSGGAEPFYWNSNTKTVVNLRNGVSGDEGSVYDYFLGENGIFYVLWQDDLGSPTYTWDYRLWDSANGQNQLIVNSSNGQPTQLLSDGAGNAHVLWKDSSTTYHWDSVDQTSLAVGNGAAPPLAYMNAADGKTGDHIHIVWAEEDTNWPTHQTDLFYWRSDMTSAINVTDHGQPAADVENVRLLIDETDVAHVLWFEGAPAYYNSADDMTTILTGTLSSVSGRRMAMPPLDGPAEFGDVMTARAGEAYVLLGNDATTPYRVWQSAADTYTGITAVYGSTTPGSRMIWLDSSDQVHVAWEDNSLTGEGTNLHYWNATSGSQDLTDNDQTDQDIVPQETFGIADASGNVYLSWPEFFDGETDLYAASKPVQYEYIYLPVVLK
ncbi:MAG: hypothetical protein P8183_18380, partial [Anaerolineae bacterium]